MPTSGKYLLDTNIVIAILDGEREALSNLLGAGEVFVSAVALGELYFGAAKSGRPIENSKRVLRFAETTTVLSCDADVASHYGSLKHRLREKGRPIPENDIWIAALAICEKLSVVTRDRHFAEVDGLLTVDWAVCMGAFGVQRVTELCRPRLAPFSPKITTRSHRCKCSV